MVHKGGRRTLQDKRQTEKSIARNSESALPGVSMNSASCSLTAPDNISGITAPELHGGEIVRVYAIMTACTSCACIGQAAALHGPCDRAMVSWQSPKSKYGTEGTCRTSKHRCSHTIPLESLCCNSNGGKVTVKSRSPSDATHGVSRSSGPLRH